MKYESFIAAAFFLIFLSGCTQPPEPSGEINLVKSMQLPQGWQISSVEYDVSEEVAARISFSNDAVLCKYWAMTEEYVGEFPATVYVEFYKKESFSQPLRSGVVETENYFVWVNYGQNTSFPQSVLPCFKASEELAGQILALLLPNNEIEAVKSIELPAGWELSLMGYGSDFDERIAAKIEFSNPNLLCKEMAMGYTGREVHPHISVVFFKKQFAEEIKNETKMSAMIIVVLETKNYAIIRYPSPTTCSDDSGESVVSQNICRALEPFKESDEGEWGWYCE